MRALSAAGAAFAVSGGSLGAEELGDLAAGMIADAVKSRGRSRHGQLAAAAMTVAKSSGRHHAPTAYSDDKPPSHIYFQRPPEQREARLLESVRRGSSEEGNTPRWALFPWRGVKSSVVAWGRLSGL